MLVRLIPDLLHETSVFMRQIGTIPDGQDAERFADYLRGQGVACSLDAVDSAWAVWVQNEDYVASARQDLAAFLAEPQHERYRDARQQANARLREEYERRQAVRRQSVSLRQQWDRPLGERCPLTVGLMVACVIVAVYTRLGGAFPMPGEHAEDFQHLISPLWISPDGSWRSLLSGEIWRIWTPMLLHYGWMHILFNGFWLRDLGMLLESRLGTARFLGLVLVIGAASHLIQFQFGSLEPETIRHFGLMNVLKWLPHSYRFGGMSGVVYGLFGYLWVRGRVNPRDGLGVSEQSVVWMMVWFFVCWTGLLGPIANWAHTGGLAAGALLGYRAAKRSRHRS